MLFPNTFPQELLGRQKVCSILVFLVGGGGGIGSDLSNSLGLDIYLDLESNN